MYRVVLLEYLCESWVHVCSVFCRGEEEEDVEEDMGVHVPVRLLCLQSHTSAQSYCSHMLTNK